MSTLIKRLFGHLYD